MMKKHQIYHFFNLTVCTLLLVSFLSGCTQINRNFKHEKSSYLNGNIYSTKGKIPENATAIITFSQSSSTGEKDKTLYEYSLLNQKENNNIPFNLFFSDKLLLISSSINISVRIEKEGIPIMMSDRMTPFPKKTDDKLILTVNAG